MLHFLFGRALARWLEKLFEEPSPETPPLAPEITLAPPAPVAEMRAASPEEGEWAYPRVQRAAMGSLFEIYLAGTDRETLLGAAEEALDEIERLERQLSHYRDDSDIARLNLHAAAQWVRLEPRLYQLLKRCAALHTETGGAFDITTGPLTKAWGFYRGEGRIPPDEEIAQIMARVGAQRILFDEEDHLIHFPVPGMEINLGAIGKGYAIDAAVETLRFYGIRNAVLHGGQSTIYAIGKGVPEGTGNREQKPHSALSTDLNAQRSTLNAPSGWEFTLRDPRDRETPIQTLYLRDEAISTSGSYEQFFEVDGVRYSHILDPRAGHPTRGMISVSVIAPSAAESDALSTAFFVLGREATEEFCRARPNLRVIMIEERDGNEIEVTRIGFETTDA